MPQTKRQLEQPSANAQVIIRATGPNRRPRRKRHRRGVAEESADALALVVRQEQETSTAIASLDAERGETQRALAEATRSEQVQNVEFEQVFQEYRVESDATIGLLEREVRSLRQTVRRNEEQLQFILAVAKFFFEQSRRREDRLQTRIATLQERLQSSEGGREALQAELDRANNLLQETQRAYNDLKNIDEEIERLNAEERRRLEERVRELEASLAAKEEDLRASGQAATERTEEVDRLKEDIRNLRADLAAKTTKIEDLERAVADRDLRITQATEEILDYEQQVSDRGETIDGLRNTIDELQGQIRAGAAELIRLQEKLQMSEDLRKHTSLRWGELSRKHDAQTSELQQARRELGEVQTELSQTRRTMSDEIKKLRDEVERLRTRLKPTEEVPQGQNRVDELLKLVTTLEEKLEETLNELVKTGGLLEQLDAEHKRLLDESGAASRKIQQLESELADERSQKDVLQNRIADLQVQIDGETAEQFVAQGDLQRELNAAKDEVERLKKNEDRLVRQLGEVRVENTRLTEKLETTEARAKELNQNLKDVTHDLEVAGGLSVERDELKASLRASETELTKARTALSEKEMEVEELRKKLSEYETLIREATREVTSQKEVMNNLEQVLSKLEREKTESTTELEQKIAELLCKGIKLSKKQAEIDKLLEKIANLENALDTLKNDNAKLRTTIETLKRQAVENRTTEQLVQKKQAKREMLGVQGQQLAATAKQINNSNGSLGSRREVEQIVSRLIDIKNEENKTTEELKIAERTLSEGRIAARREEESARMKALAARQAVEASRFYLTPGRHAFPYDDDRPSRRGRSYETTDRERLSSGGPAAGGIAVVATGGLAMLASVAGTFLFGM